MTASRRARPRTFRRPRREPRRPAPRLGLAAGPGLAWPGEAPGQLLGTCWKTAGAAQTREAGFLKALAMERHRAGRQPALPAEQPSWQLLWGLLTEQLS